MYSQRELTWAMKNAALKVPGISHVWIERVRRKHSRTTYLIFISVGGKVPHHTQTQKYLDAACESIKRVLGEDFKTVNLLMQTTTPEMHRKWGPRGVGAKA